mmetsp:Transcript_27592/g.68786  ORF Transcript_27592/g.68786 Transcript_27592/m.68786 type:complete len:225 (+) Transcript_27592:971-1645(+)
MSLSLSLATSSNSSRALRTVGPIWLTDASRCSMCLSRRSFSTSSSIFLYAQFNSSWNFCTLSFMTFSSSCLIRLAAFLTRLWPLFISLRSFFRDLSLSIARFSPSCLSHADPSEHRSFKYSTGVHILSPLIVGLSWNSLSSRKLPSVSLGPWNIAMTPASNNKSCRQPFCSSMSCWRAGARPGTMSTRRRPQEAAQAALLRQKTTTKKNCGITAEESMAASGGR